MDTYLPNLLPEPTDARAAYLRRLSVSALDEHALRRLGERGIAAAEIVDVARDCIRVFNIEVLTCFCKDALLFDFCEVGDARIVRDDVLKKVGNITCTRYCSGFCGRHIKSRWISKSSFGKPEIFCADVHCVYKKCIRIDCPLDGTSSRVRECHGTIV